MLFLQVRPKPATPATTVPIAPAPTATCLPPMLATPQLVQRPVMLATKLSAGSIPAAPGPITQLRILNGQSGATITKSLTTTQLTGIVITTPATIAPIQLSTAPMQQASSISAEAKVSAHDPPLPAHGPWIGLPMARQTLGLWAECL